MTYAGCGTVGYEFRHVRISPYADGGSLDDQLRAGSFPRLVSFSVSADETEKWLGNVKSITTWIRELAALARVMFDSGALYANGESPTRNTPPASTKRR